MALAANDLAARQYSDYQRRCPGTYFGEDHQPLSVEDAYAVQAEVASLHERNANPIAGYKVGCIGPKVREQFGMNGPIRGFVYAGEMHRSGAEVSASAHSCLAIEGEMAVRLGAGGEITAAFPVIELHNYVFRGQRKTLAELIANNGLHAGVVLPASESPISASLEHASGGIEVWRNGELVDSGPLWGFGTPDASVEWLRSHLHQHGLALHPGQLILAGTPLGLHPVEAGDRIEVFTGVLGSVTMTVIS